MLYHFSQQDGKKAFEAGDARKEEAIVNFMRNPKEPPPPPPPEKPWSDEPSEVVHLTEDSFGNSLSMTRNVQPNINAYFYSGPALLTTRQCSFFLRFFNQIALSANNNNKR